MHVPEKLSARHPDDRGDARVRDAQALTGILRAPARRVWLSSLLEGQRWLAVRLCTDVVMLVLGVLFAVALEPGDSGAPLLALFPPLTLALLSSRGRYRQRLSDVVVDSIAPGFGAISIAAMSLFVLTSVVYGTRPGGSSLVMIAWLASFVGVTAAGAVLTTGQHLARKRRLVERPTLIIGADEAGCAVARRLTAHPEFGLRPVGFLDNPRDGLGPMAAPSGQPVLGVLDDLADVAVAVGIGHVVLGFPAASDPELLALIKRCDELHLETMVLPRLSGSINYQTQFEYLGTVPLLNLRAIDPDGWRFAVKYLTDRLIAAVLLVVVAPVLVLAAIAVKLSSPGPILFAQQRSGRDGQQFKMLKFRTMVEAGEHAEEFTVGSGLAPGGIEGADRRTRAGRFLRRTSLDELPQLLNVIRGEMSLVGPRPERPEFSEMFSQRFARYHDRDRVRSGITGWAQVHGHRGQTSLADRVEFDNFYIEHWSLALDLKILLLTVPALLKGS